MSGSALPVAAVFGLRLPARCLVPVLGAKEGSSKFLAGTVALRENNDIVVLEYHEDPGTLVTADVYEYPKEVWQMVTNPDDAELVMVMGGSGEDRGASLHRMAGAQLEELCSVEVENLESIAWCPENVSIAMGLEASGSVSRLSIGDGECSVSSKCQYEADGSRGICCCWDPHHEHVVAAGVGANLCLFDLRDKKLSSEIKGCHAPSIRSIDANPNKPMYFATCGDDGSVSVWDVRKEGALCSMNCHSHWAWCAKYNPSHDELLVSSSSDCCVNLLHIPTVSSAAGPGSSAVGRNCNTVAGYLAEHEDSVYSVAWSSSDAWTFASLSYDGRIVVNHVPQPLKYGILL